MLALHGQDIKIKAQVSTRPGGPECPPHTGCLLLADTELTDNGGVAPCIVGFEVVEETATSADHHEEAAARAVVFFMEFEMVRQLANARAEQRDLHFGTAGVAFMRAVLADDALLMFGG